MSLRMVKFQVSSDFIREAMAMPNGTRIYNIVRHDYRPDIFVFYVEHPDFYEVYEGGAIPWIDPTIEADYTKKPATWLTFSWGTPAVTPEES